MKIVGQQTEWGNSKNNRQVLCNHFLQKRPFVGHPDFMHCPPSLQQSPSIDVFLFQITKTNKGDIRLSKTTTLIHVATDASLVDLKALVRAQSESFVLRVYSSERFLLVKKSHETTSGTEKWGRLTKLQIRLCKRWKTSNWDPNRVLISWPWSRLVLEYALIRGSSSDL